MTLAAGAHPIGPGNGTLHLRTGREGMASKVGHDLLITFGTWSGTVTVGAGHSADPDAVNVAVEIDLTSLEVVEGTGGVASLSADDRREITTTALRLLGTQQYPTARFTSTGVTRDGADSGAVDGTFELNGSNAPLRLSVAATGNGAYRATGSVLQSALGIKPYKAFFGALRLADMVQIEATAELPA